MKNKPVEILLVEDNPADIRWTVETFREYHIPHKIHNVKDGSEALDFLYKKGKYKGVPYPDIIILDLYLPRISGHEVLEKIKNDKNLKFIPVVILTASNSPYDAPIAYRNHADCYISKPLNFEGLMKIVHLQKNFGLNYQQCPYAPKCQANNVSSFKHHHI